MMLAEVIDNFNSESDTEDDEFMEIDGDCEIDGVVPVFDIPDVQAEDYQIMTEQNLAKIENPQMSFILNKKS